MSTWITEEHAAYGETVRRFLAEQCTPNHAQWNRDGMVSRELWRAGGELGILGASFPEEYGGSGLGKSFDAITFIEQGRAGDSGWGTHVHNFVGHYLLAYGSEAQKSRWLPGLIDGSCVAAIAMTEPGTGSDLRSVRTTALPDGDGGFLLNGAKTFISNGQLADLVLVVAKTDPEAGGGGISLMLVDAHSEGFRRGRNLEKIGLKRQDTSELFFDDVRLPADALLGEEPGRGFAQLGTQLAWERLTIGLFALGFCEYALSLALDYSRERKAFGQRVFDFQNSRFVLADVATRVEALRAFLDSGVEALEAGELTPERAAMIKLYATETQCQVVDECLQLHGGYGYMLEYPIAELYADSRVQKIYGGTNEIMKEIITRGLDSQ